jgi:hypothetical protein
MCVNSREVNFDEEFYPTDDVVYFISPKTVLKQHGKLWYLILYTRGSQPGGRVPLGGLERSQISDLLGTFVPVGGHKWS